MKISMNFANFAPICSRFFAEGEEIALDIVPIRRFWRHEFSHPLDNGKGDFHVEPNFFTRSDR